MHKRISIAAISTAMLLLSGCASYHAASLNYLPEEIITQGSESNKKELKVAAKAFDKADCKRYLDRDVLRQGYQPIQLYIQNDSNKSYAFSLSRLNLSIAESEEVARTVHTSTIGRILWYGVPGLILSPFGLGLPLIIPAVVDGIKSSEANDALDVDYYVKTIKDDQVIGPHSHFNKLVFVDAAKYQSSFSLTLIEQGTKKEEIFSLNAG